MNVVDIAKDNLGILVIIIGLESTIFQTVCLGVHFGSSIVDDHPGIAHYRFLHVRGFANLLNHDFILH